MTLRWGVSALALAVAVTGSLGTAVAHLVSPSALHFGVGFIVLGTPTSLQDAPNLPYGLGYGLLSIGATAAGGAVWARVPGNAVGPILLALGGGVGFTQLCATYAEISVATALGPLVGAAYAAWLGTWLSIPVFFGLPGFLLMLFPTGRLISPNWRPLPWLMGATVGVATVAWALIPPRMSGYYNPVVVTGPARPVLSWVMDTTERLGLPLFAAAALTIALRLRTSRGVERQQLKAFTYVAALVGVGLGTTAATAATHVVVAGVAFFLGLLALAGLPVAAGVAVLRYRLYDIDVVIKRTLVYGALTATLVATYLGAVLVLQLALRPLTSDSELAVAGSTLAVAALFRPARARIQSIVDRRFFRARYDATRTLDAFSTRLRDELDLESLGTDLRQVVTETMQPAHVTLWLREAKP